jgi:tripeptide aminopeptidase
VQEEAGLCGASNFASTSWQVTDGIVFDNAFAAGIVVSKGAAYEAFDIKISGRTGHPGKDLSSTVHAVDIFRAANYPHGSLAEDQTRINIGRIVGGSARNAIPEMVTIEGELRSFEAEETRRVYKQAIIDAFTQAARTYGGRVDITFKTYSTGYEISADEPLLGTYREVLLQHGAELQMQPTFIGSDTSGFRPAVKVFTVSTGVMNEHSVDEYVALDPLEQLVNDALHVLNLWRQHH